MKLFKMFRNVSIKKKVFAISLILMTFLIIVSGFSIYSTKKLINNFEINYRESTEKLKELFDNNSSSGSLLTEITAIITGSNKTNKQLTEYKEGSLNHLDELSGSLSEYKNILLNESSEDHKEEIKILDEMIQIVDVGFVENINKIFEHVNYAQFFESYDEYENITVPLHSKFISNLEKLRDLSVTYSENQQIESLKQNNIMVLAIIIISALAVIVAIIFSVFAVKSIVNPINELLLATKEIADGNLNINLDTDRKDETGELALNFKEIIITLQNLTSRLKNMSGKSINGDLQVSMQANGFKGEFKHVVEEINNMSEILQEDIDVLKTSLENFANGDFTFEVKEFPGEKRIINEAIDLMKDNFSSFSEDRNILINRIMEGNLKDEIDSSKYNGEWKEIIDDLNKLFKAIYEPIFDTSVSLEKISKGEFDFRIDKDYKGEFKIIKDSVNFTTITVSSYISEISEILEALEEKDFTVKIEREYVGIFDNIRTSINNIIESFNETLHNIDDASNQIAIGTRNISNSSMSIADGATKQSKDIDDLSTVISGVTKESLVVSEIALSVSEAVDVAKKSAESGNLAMNEMLTSMDEINKANENISIILETINDIAFQTNLLALNAAVEAARAGQHGRGFAVVAEEVRSLALRSREAAEKTNVIINETHRTTLEGTEIAKKTALELDKISEEVLKATDLAKKIAKVSQDNSEKIEAINSNIMNIEQVIQMNSATSQENAAASQELSSQSEVFRELIESFKIN